ncbi:MAG: 2-oxo acid dehydrogenase subunit E2 [Planctomycetes bacterium]|nr:2-oxo acid dehydrogenase subunit E2 [Planctomycetota bacterium]
MAVVVQMPKQGNTVEECLLVEWKVKVGDAVKENDILCSIETDKTAFEVPATAAGIILKLLAKAGDLVPVLSDIVVIGEAGEDVLAAPPPKPAEKTVPEPVSLSESGATAETVLVSMFESCSDACAASGESRPVSPRARKLAEKAGVDLAAVFGTGPGGRTTSRDVQAALDGGAVVKASPLAREIMAVTGQTPGAGTGVGGLCLARDLAAANNDAARPIPAEAASEDIPYKGIRKLIGDRMSQSLREHAQLTMNASAGAAGLIAMRQILKDGADKAGLPKISINDMICWVTAQTLPSFPWMNAIFDRAGARIVKHRRVNLAVAVDTPRGLMVPVVADAHRLSLAALSQSISQLAEECRKGSINPDLLTGGTFTISNLGGFGIKSFTPILNTPQVAILGVSAITDQPVRKADGGIDLAPCLELSLTIDHQAVDGAPAARFLQALAQGIRDIQAILAIHGAHRHG